MPGVGIWGSPFGGSGCVCVLEGHSLLLYMYAHYDLRSLKVLCSVAPDPHRGLIFRPWRLWPSSRQCTLLRNIIESINRVRHFRRQCVELGEMAALLLVVLEADDLVDASEDAAQQDPTQDPSTSSAATNSVLGQGSKPAAFKEAKTWERLRATLKEIQVFVEKCTREWNFLRRGLEIFVRRTVPRLKQELFEWISLCIMEPRCADHVLPLINRWLIVCLSGFERRTPETNCV
jgi:hypothetical protein